MSDILLELGKNPALKRLIASLGLPIPMPQDLRRATGDWRDRPLADQAAVVGTFSPNATLSAVARTLARAGADSQVVGNKDALAVFQSPGEAFGRPARLLDLEAELPPGLRPHALVYDASEARSPDDLTGLYDFFHPLVRRVARCGKVVVLGRPPEDQKSAVVAATQSALAGFTRSLAKELGRRGATAQLLYVSRGAEPRLAGPLRFFLTARSAYVSGQPVRVTARATTRIGEPRWTRPLEGKVALVTGAARGIGAATARRLAAEGARVICLDRPQDDGPTSRLAREIGGSVLLLDVTAPDASARIVEVARGQRNGGLDIVVHNAGVTRDKTLGRMSADHWSQALDINLGAVVRITSALLEGALREAGRIICLSSIAGIAGNVGQTNYAASKSGLVGLVGRLAAETAKRGVTVNAVAPGFIETRLTAAMPVAVREVARRMNSLGQGGLPSDVAEAITFLASPGASGVTGQVLRVCGQSLVGA